jgi:hypothetical protein
MLFVVKIILGRSERGNNVSRKVHKTPRNEFTDISSNFCVPAF